MTSMLLDDGAHFLCCSLIACVVDSDLCSLLCKPNGYRTANAAGASFCYVVFRS